MNAPVPTPAYKALLRRVLARAGIDIRRRRNVPFGVRWEDDLHYYLRGRSLRAALDIGRHTGETALALLEAFPGVTVHSFEPVPENYAVLQRASAGGDVRTVQAAVSDSSGTVPLARGSTSLRGSVHGGGPTIEVPAVTVEEYVRERRIDRVELLKIDTEGHEEAGLRGASGLLQSAATEFILCECEFTPREDEPHGNLHAIFDLLEPWGYRVGSFYTAGVDSLGWLWGDVLFRHAPGQRDARWASRSPYVQRNEIN